MKKYNYEKRENLRKWIYKTGNLIGELKSHFKNMSRHHTVEWKGFQGSHEGPENWNKNVFKNVKPTNWNPNEKFVIVTRSDMEKIQEDFRCRHVAASIMRGKTLEQIETLPTRDTKVGPYKHNCYPYDSDTRCNEYGYFRKAVNMEYVNKILKEYEDETVEDVCSGNGQTEQESTGSAGGACVSGVSADETKEVVEPNVSVSKGNGDGTHRVEIPIGG